MAGQKESVEPRLSYKLITSYQSMPQYLGGADRLTTDSDGVKGLRATCFPVRLSL